MRWETVRERALSRLSIDIESGEVDEELVEVLRLLNENEDIATTSSCSGRIIVGCNDTSWEDKRGTVIPFKSHSPVSVPEVLEVLNSLSCKNVWMKVSHPLLDVAVRELERALKLVEIARRAGFKYSGVQPSREYYHVIIRGSDSVQYPLSGEEDLKVIARVVGHANRVLLDGKVRLAKLISLLEEEGFISELDDLFPFE